MNRWKFRNRLGLQLLAGVLAALGVSAGLFRLLDFFGTRALDSYVGTEQFQERQRNAAGDRLQRYVLAQDVSLSNLQMLDRWVDEENYVFLMLVQDGRVLYDSTLSALVESGDMAFDEGFYDADSSYTQWRAFREIEFTDGTARADLTCYYEYQYYAWVTAAAGILSFVLFVLLLLLLLRFKLRYIAQLERELHVLEGGRLETPVTVRGSDELAQLAQGIDDMRRSIIERQQGEREARCANQQLITAMSHDLRTPLTSLMGYLDLLELGKYHDEAQLRHFIHSSRDKAYQLKSMSDKLFEYALVYGKGEETVQLETVDALELMQQTLGEYAFELESRGFQVQAELPELHCTVQIAPELLRRVFDNLYSNLLKYADRSYPIQMRYAAEENRLEISVKNRLGPDAGAVESTNLGLQTCKKVLALHHGGFEVQKDTGSFSVLFWLPCSPYPGQGQVS